MEYVGCGYNLGSYKEENSPPERNCTNTRTIEFVLFLFYESFGVCLPREDKLGAGFVSLVLQTITIIAPSLR